jgi:pyridoxal phosphate enzyme (YggS family)
MADDHTARLAAVRERIERAARRAGREPETITLVAVAKRKPAEDVAALAAAGAVHFGENFVQEAREKIPRVAHLRGAAARALCWHFVGRLQTNKAKWVATLFDQIESLDRPELADALDRHAARAGRVLDALIQVNLCGEAQKGGVSPEALPELAARVGDCKHLRLRGLMTVPAAGPDAESARPVFRALRSARDDLCARSAGLTLPVLSMGMSADLEVAIEEGATRGRVGTALFGARE